MARQIRKFTGLIHRRRRHWPFIIMIPENLRATAISVMIQIVNAFSKFHLNMPGAGFRLRDGWIGCVTAGKGFRFEEVAFPNRCHVYLAGDGPGRLVFCPAGAR